jgi:DNA polymerase elongation subunit (family B)
VKHLGWILDLYHKPGQMVVWLKKPDGSCVRLTDRWKPRIHVGGEYRDLVKLACNPYIGHYRFVEKFERAGDLEKSLVLEVEVESDSEAATLANRIQREGKYSRFRLYDIDVPAPQFYLYSKNLFPLALVEVDTRGEQLSWSLKDSRETIDYENPPLRKIRLEVATRKTRKVQTFADEIGTIEVTSDGEEIRVDSGSETEKILELVKIFRVEDPDIVITNGGDSFIFPYLARRANENGILDKLILSRDPSPLRIYEVQGHSYFSYGKILYRETAARLLGRLHIDDYNAFISVDCGLEGLFEISRTCIIPIQRSSRATIGTNMTSLQLYHAVKKEVLIPWNKNQPEEWKDSEEVVDADRGGLIFGPTTGIHDDVGELDFTSLYPTLMRDKNLSGETVNCKCCPDSPLRVPELDYSICSRRKGIVSESLDILLRRRKSYKKLKRETKNEAKRSVYDQRQSALKWILVCCLPFNSPVLISQNGRISYQQIGRIIDEQIGDNVGVFDCSTELFVAGVDKDLRSKFCRVSRLIKTPSPKKLLRVKMDDGREIKCTSNHSLYILREGRLIEVKAESLSKGDLVPIAKHIAHNSTDKTVKTLDLLECIRQKIEPVENDLWRARGDSLGSVVNSSSKALEILLKKEGRHVQNLRTWRNSGIVPFHYLQFLSLPRDPSRLLIGRGRIGGGHVAWLPSSLDVDEDLGFFLGFYVADGSAGENFIRLDVGGDEGEIVDHLTDIIRTKFGLTPRVYKETKANMFIVQINSISLVQILNRVFGLSSSSDTGKLIVPQLLFNASKKAILGFISGLVAGDGSVNKAREHVSISTKSHDFAVQVGYLALLLGLPFNIIRGKRLHRIYFMGPEGLHPFKNTFLKKSHRSRFETMRTSCHSDCHHAIFEMFPVEQSGLKEVASLARTVRTPRLEGRFRVCPERARKSLERIAGNTRFSQLQDAHSRIMKLLDADVCFAAVKEVEQIEAPSPFVYCFEISDYENFPAFFTGNGGVLVHNSFGYLGFKNARFGKIDAHIATCAFSRVFLERAVALAQAQGFTLVHGIVDSLWLTKPGATDADYQELCALLESDLKIPLSYEGRYRWIVFLNSKTESQAQVLNRYYGIFQDRTLKVRGIDLRRHDTPPIVNKCQEDMLSILSQADDSEQFKALIPKALKTVEEYAGKLRNSQIPIEDLVFTRSLSKEPGEYSHKVPQAIAAQLLKSEGGSVHAGQQVNYILTVDSSKRDETSSTAPELADENTVIDHRRYVDLLISSTANLLLPFGYNRSALAISFDQTIPRFVQVLT